MQAIRLIHSSMFVSTVSRQQSKQKVKGQKSRDQAGGQRSSGIYQLNFHAPTLKFIDIFKSQQLKCLKFGAAVISSFSFTIYKTLHFLLFKFINDRY